MALIPKVELLSILQGELSPIKDLILEQLPNPKDDNFSYDNRPIVLNASDPFFSIEKPTEGNYNLDNLYDWYLTKNPEFKPVNTEGLNIIVPEFKFLISVMAKDLLILHHTNKYPQKHETNTNNSKKYKNHPSYEYKMKSIELFSKLETDNSKSMKVLTLINEFIKTYSYLEFLVILRHYLLLFTIGKLYSEENKNTCEKITIIDKLMDKPHILYPTILQISYAKVIYTMQAPVINFRLSNNRKKIHDDFESPMYELVHDVDFHGNLTHKWEQSEFERIFRKPFVPKIEFFKLNNIIQILKPYISYKNKPLPDNSNKQLLTDYYNKQLLTFIIFNLIHENGSVLDLFNLYIRINLLKQLVNNNFFLRDDSLKKAVEYAYKCKTKSNLNNEIIQTLQKTNTMFSDSKEITVPIIDHILETFTDLWKSLAPLTGGSYNKKNIAKKLYKSKTKKQIKRKYKQTLNR